MGRRPRSADAVPRLCVRVYGGRRRWYYDHGIVAGKRKREALGSDYAKAIQRWAELEGLRREERQALVLFRDVADQYRLEVIPTKAARTQRDNLRELAQLLEFFDDPPTSLDAVEPQHVAQYMRWRRAAPIRANRERALLSHLWNWARAQGYTAQPNPCTGVKGNPQRPRTTYISDADYQAIIAHADPVLRDAMDIAYLTGQRPGDVLKMREGDLRDGVVRVQQGKTGALEEIAIVGELAAVIARIRVRKQAYTIYNTRLIVNESGRPFGVNALSRRWRRAADAAGLPGVQFRDLRAKAATDKLEASGDVIQAQRLLGHASVRMTEAYIRAHKGTRITPVR